MVHRDGDGSGDHLGVPAPRVRFGGVGELRRLFASRIDPAGEPLRREIGVLGTESPGARSRDDLESSPFEGGCRGADSVGAEETSAGGTAPLVRVERVHHQLVEGVSGGQLDLAHDAERDENRAAGCGTAGDEPVELVGGEHVEQRGGSDQGDAGQVARIQPGDVVEPGLDGDRGPVCGPGRWVGRGVFEQLRVPVVQHPSLRSAQLRARASGPWNPCRNRGRG